MCQQVLENWYCSDCNRFIRQQNYANNCRQATSRRAGDCRDGIKPHRGSPKVNMGDMCSTCEARYEQSMIDRDNHSYQDGNYTW